MARVLAPPSPIKAGLEGADQGETGRLGVGKEVGAGRGRGVSASTSMAMAELQREGEGKKAAAASVLGFVEL